MKDVGEAALSGRLHRLGSFDVFRLETLRPVGDIKAHSFTLLQRTVTVTLNGRKVNENILPAFASDKSVSPRGIKPEILPSKNGGRVLTSMTVSPGIREPLQTGP